MGKVQVFLKPNRALKEDCVTVFPCGISAAYYALGPLKASWVPPDMFLNGWVSEVAVSAGIRLMDWRLSKFWQLLHFSFTAIHDCITIRGARTHCCWGKKGSSGNRGAASALAGAQVVQEQRWYGHTPFVAVPSVSYFNEVKLPPYQLKLYWGLSGFLRSCLARGTRHLLEPQHKSPAGAAESGRYHRRHPAARQWQIHTFCQKYKVFCCWADNGIADPKKNHD